MATEVFFFNKAALNDEAARAFILDMNFKSHESAVSLPSIRFNAFWTKMPVTFYEMKPEELFSILNGESNPFATGKRQEWIRANGVSHTSMSVGDIVHVTTKAIDRTSNWLDNKEKTLKDEWLVCVGTGFAPLKLEVVA